MIADTPEHPFVPDPAEGSLLRRRVLDAAQAMVERAGGLSVSLDRVSMEQAIREARVPRASAYREWPNKAAFQLDLLCDLAGPSWQGTAAFDEETIRLARDVVAERLDQLATEAGRRAVLRETVRQAAEQNFRAVTTSPQWRSYVTISATVLSFESPDDQERVLTALRTAEATFIARMARFYEDMGLMLGFRLRPWAPSFETLAAVGASVVEGLGLRNLIAPGIVAQQIDFDSDNTRPWSIAAVGFYSVLDQFVEPIQDYDFPSALAGYLKRLSEREASTL